MNANHELSGSELEINMDIFQQYLARAKEMSGDHIATG
jgi:hypothetical protein